jgi:phosphatidylglycerophosphatase C
MRSAMRLYGDEKVCQLARLGVRPRWEIAYSDSLSDLPMLDGADHPVLVNADAPPQAPARQALGPRLSFAVWS